MQPDPRDSDGNRNSVSYPTVQLSNSMLWNSVPRINLEAYLHICWMLLLGPNSSDLWQKDKQKPKKTARICFFFQIAWHVSLEECQENSEIYLDVTWM